MVLAVVILPLESVIPPGTISAPLILCVPVIAVTGEVVMAPEYTLAIELSSNCAPQAAIAFVPLFIYTVLVVCAETKFWVTEYLFQAVVRLMDFGVPVSALESICKLMVAVPD